MNERQERRRYRKAEWDASWRMGKNSARLVVGMGFVIMLIAVLAKNQIDNPVYSTLTLCEISYREHNFDLDMLDRECRAVIEDAQQNHGYNLPAHSALVRRALPETLTIEEASRLVVRR